MAATRVFVTGATSALGERVVAKLREAGADVAASDAAPSKRALEGVDVVVHLARPTMLQSVLDAAGDAAVEGVVVTSSATVYGAWSDNSVPLTEDASLRPNPGFTFAAEQAEGERVAAEWKDDHPSSAVAVLRLVPVLLPSGETWLSAALASPSLVRPADSLPPVQVIHVEDAATAIVHAVLQRLDGTFNVAPEGSVNGETARALSAAGVPVPLPERLAGVVERLAWRLRVGGAPPAAVPYREHPWVVASDRLRATGWQPAYSVEEALVACRKGSWWRELSPKRRQEVALSVAGGVLVTGAAGVALAVKAASSRASRRG
ncbi:MAG TPA: NAD-dependent epimerase/dehydratase family protein [Acidimicrobiales bacterium]|jgi:nucleoside-diphosphate-sugar epimerase|nr:NAD-dependent epimerase/dehydratase family protein [Acidimicrobiales bacterium]